MPCLAYAYNDHNNNNNSHSNLPKATTAANKQNKMARENLHIDKGTHRHQTDPQELNANGKYAIPSM